MRPACENADILAVFTDLAMGDVFVDTIKGIEGKTVMDARGEFPYLFERPWTYALKGKKVLVVSPFSDTIKRQYEQNREKLFRNPQMLPEFESLETVDSVFYFYLYKDPRFKSWFEAYDYLYDEIMKHDFDIALLGCSAFGFPLAAKIKMAGKQAVHTGGMLQMMFGIKGKRWDEQGWYNEYWVYPPEESKPPNAEGLDGATYWK